MDQSRTQETNPSTVKDGFGVHLRREREMRGVTLEEISSATRIGTRFLDALETEHWERLPGGVFNRGFVRSTAQFLGLDPEAMLAEYTLATTDSARTAPPVYIHSQSSWTPRNAAPVGDRRWLTLAALIAIAAIAAGGWFGWRHYRAVRRARAADAAMAAAAAISDANDAAASSEASPAAATAAGTASNAPGTSSRPGGEAPPTPDGSSSAPAAVTPNANDAAATPAEAADPAAAATSTAATAPASASASGPLILKIEAGRATTVRVSVDGHKTFSGKIPAGGSKTFQANEVFYVTARDAGGVLLELNGQTLPPLGPQGRSGSIRLTRETLTSQDGTSH